MIIERQIENAIVAAVSASGLPDGVRIVSAWDPAVAGDVKGTEDESGIVVAVAVAPRAYDSFMSPQADFACSIALSVRRDMFPTGAEVEDVSERLFAMLDRWNRDEESVYAELSTEDFDPGGLQLTGGSGPSLDGDGTVWTVAQSFTLRGICR